jgi:hypothetical protein
MTRTGCPRVDQYTIAFALFRGPVVIATWIGATAHVVGRIVAVIAVATIMVISAISIAGHGISRHERQRCCRAAQQD